MVANTSSFRARREIFTELVSAIGDNAPLQVALEEEIFFAMCQFLTICGDPVPEDTCLSFNRAVLQARVVAQAVLRTRARASLIITALQAAANVAGPERP